MLWALGISGLVLFFDYITGPYISFPILFIFPVALMAWFRPCRWAIMLGAFLCAVRLSMSVQWLSETRFGISVVLTNTLIRMGVLFLVALLIARVAQQQRALHVKVRILEGILPVCAFCKKIRNEAQEWEPIETFIRRNSEAQFSHSVCPECGREHYAQFCEPAGQPKTESTVASK